MLLVHASSELQMASNVHVCFVSFPSTVVCWNRGQCERACDPGFIRPLCSLDLFALCSTSTAEVAGCAGPATGRARGHTSVLVSNAFAHIIWFTMQYINLLEPRAVRAQLLAETKFFTCACARCAAPLATSPDRFLEVCHRIKYRHNRFFKWLNEMVSVLLMPAAAPHH